MPPNRIAGRTLRPKARTLPDGPTDVLLVGEIPPPRIRSVCTHGHGHVFNCYDCVREHERLLGLVAQPL